MSGPEELRALVEEMRAGLEGVTPGPWYQTGAPWFRSGDGVLAGSPDGNIAYIIADCDNFAAPRDEYDGPFPLGDQERDAAHIARCSPENIAKLLDAAESSLASPAGMEGQADRIVSTLDDLKSRVEEMGRGISARDYVIATLITNAKRGKCTLSDLVEWFEKEGSAIMIAGRSALRSLEGRHE